MEQAFGQLFLYSFLAIVQIILICAAGAAMARLGIITPAVRVALSKMVFYVLLPAITFVKVSPAVTATLLAHWWPIAVNVVLSVCGGLGLGALVALATRTPRHLHRHVIVATGLGNLNQLPLMLVTSICADPRLLLRSAVGPTCTDQGIAYVVVGMAVASIFHHAVSYHLLKPRPEPDVRLNRRGTSSGMQVDTDELLTTSRACRRSWSLVICCRLLRYRGVPRRPAPDPLTWTPPAPGRASECVASRADSASDLRTADSLGKSVRGRASLHRGFSEDYNAVTLEVEAGPRATGEALVSCSAPEAASAPRSGRARRLRGTLARCWRAVRSGAGRFFDIIPVPTFVSIIGLGVGCIPPLKAALFGSNAPLAFATDALAVIASATVPAMSFTLGAVLHKGPGKAAVGWPSIGGVIFARLALVPVLGSVMVLGGAKLGVFPPLNPLFLFVLLLQNTSPTAINIQAIATMHGNHENEMAVLLFWQYMASIVLLPVLISAYIYLLPIFGMAAVTSM